MQILNKKALASAGLALVIGSFAGATWAVDYVDQETKRAELAQVAPDDPYAPRGTQQAYPTTSFGAGTPPAPAAPAPATPAAGAPGAPAYAPAAAPVNAAAQAAAPVAAQPVMQQPQDQNLGALFMQIQQLQQQIMLINGRLEEQANEMRTLQEQSLQRYVDLDKRLSSAAAGGAAAAAPTTPASANAPLDASSNPASAPAAALATPPGAAPAAAQPGEAEAYEAAYSLVRSQKFDQAIAAFQQFQRNYPAGMYAPNAYYWLGELYLVVQPPDLESSRQAFTMLLSQYPDNGKAPDALYKLGKVQCMKGNREKAKEYLDQVISRYGSTSSSAVKLAREFNYETC